MTDLIYRPPTRKLNFTVNVFKTMEEIRRSRENFERYNREIDKKVIERRIADLKRLRMLVGRKRMKKDKEIKQIKNNLITEIRDQAAHDRLVQELDLGESDGADSNPDWTKADAVSKHGELAEAEARWKGAAAERERERRIERARNQYYNAQQEYKRIRDNQTAEDNRLQTSERDQVPILAAYTRASAERERVTAIYNELQQTFQERYAALPRNNPQRKEKERELLRYFLNEFRPARAEDIRLTDRLRQNEQRIDNARNILNMLRQPFERAQADLEEKEREYQKVCNSVATDRENRRRDYEQLKEEYKAIIEPDYVTYRNSISNYNAERGAEYSADRKELEVKFPEEFVRSQNRRFVSVLSIRAIQMRRKFNIPFYEKLLLTPEEKETAQQKLDNLEEELTPEEKNKVLQAASTDDALGVLDVLVPNRNKKKNLPTLSDISRVRKTDRFPHSVFDVLQPYERRNATLQEWDEYIPDIYTLHCTFVHDAYNDDYTVAFLNEPLSVPRKYEQFQNQTSFKLWISDSTDNSPEPFKNRVDLLYPVKSFLKLLKFQEFKLDVWETMMRLYSYVLIIQLELEF